MPRCVADIFIVHGFVVNNAVLLCGFKQTKGKRYETSDSFDRTAAGIGHSVCVNHLCPVVAGGGGMKDEALKLALDDLIAEYHMETSSFAKRVDEIFKQALAAPTVQEPVAWRYTDSRGHYRYRGYVPGFDVEYSLLKPQALYTTPPAQPAPTVQEPVAYIRVSKTGHVMACAQTGDFYALAHGTKLYTTPPAAKRQCNWPTCQSEEYQQALAEQIKQELVTGAAQPAVPDAIGPDEDELPAYAAGWNDCRQTMLEMMK